MVLDRAWALRPRRLNRRPLNSRRSPTSQRLGLEGRPARSCWESASGTHCRGDDQRQGRAPCRRRQSAKAVSFCGEADPPRQTAASEGQKRKDQGPQSKLRPGRDLCNTGPARTRDRGRRFPLKQSG